MSELQLDHSKPIDTEPAYLHSVAPDPRRQDPLDNPRIEEAGCIGITEQKKYFVFEDDPNASVFIKRNLTPSEYLVNLAGDLVLPHICMERMKNEAAAIRFVQTHTSIPTPKIRCAFEDHGRFYLILDYVPHSVTLADIPDDKKPAVIEELGGYIAQMQAITSRVMGGLSGDVVLPYRLARALPRDEQAFINKLKFREADTPEFVLCHNDLSQHNVMVDETTYKITAIIDWEYAGFYPAEFEFPFYLRPGPSVALGEEKDDVADLLDVLEHWKSDT